MLEISPGLELVFVLKFDLKLELKTEHKFDCCSTLSFNLSLKTDLLKPVFYVKLDFKVTKIEFSKTNVSNFFH